MEMMGWGLDYISENNAGDDDIGFTNLPNENRQNYFGGGGMIK